jgi:hypothetical protein
MKFSAVGSLAATLALAFAFAGCATIPPFPEPDRSWQTFNGQLQYITSGSRVIGEFEVSRRDGDFRLAFTKGGAVPLIRVARHQQYARAEGALARGGWQGTAGKVPGPLQGWINEVPRGFSEIGPITIAAQSAAHLSGGSGSNSPRRMEIQGTQPGERFVFVFGR